MSLRPNSSTRPRISDKFIHICLGSLLHPRDPIVVTVTGAAGQIAYSLLFSLGKGDVFGSNQPILLRLFDIPNQQDRLNGVVMELIDCAFPLVHGASPPPVAAKSPCWYCETPPRLAMPICALLSSAMVVEPIKLCACLVESHDFSTQCRIDATARHK